MACYRTLANLSKSKSFYYLDDPNFGPEILKEDSQHVSPKLNALFEKIEELDNLDRQKYKRTFKHMIFTDLSQSMSIRLLSSAFVANGYTACFNGTQNEGIEMKRKGNLRKTKGKNFGVLASRPIFGAPVSAEYKKNVLRLFNSRNKDGNTHGKYIRFMILDNGFKEGIDLYDVKYVHLFEPLMFQADQKQAVGRSTRFCGQKGIQFVPQKGWELSVYIYDINHNGEKLSDTHLKAIQYNFSLMNFAAELDSVVTEGAVDRSLTSVIHTRDTSQNQEIIVSKGPLSMMSPSKKMTFEEMQLFIKSHFWNKNFVYTNSGITNKCREEKGKPADTTGIIKFTPTQNFISHFFTPDSHYKGMLLYQSVGTGKTCTAIATATNSFDRENYTILWVTRHTLKADIWKNMFKQICHINFRERIRKGERIKNKASSLSKNWIQPVSYKQFSNLLNGNNKVLEQKLFSRNGKEDPLRKTLVIIDEAHKLYADSVAAAEKPNMEILEKMINNSYQMSGRDSARILLMTATPYTENPFEMIKLLNLLRHPDDKLETNWESFSEKYLTQTGQFREDRKQLFLDEITGYISYLNRSSDKRYFAYPTLNHVIVDSSKKPNRDPSLKFNRYTKSIKDVREQKKLIKEQLDKDYTEKSDNFKESCVKIDDQINNLNCNAPELSKEAKKVCKEQYKEFKEKLKECKKKYKDLNSDKKNKIKLNKETSNIEITRLKKEYDSLTALRKDLRDFIKNTRTSIKKLSSQINNSDSSKKIKRLKEKKKNLRSLIVRKIYEINSISNKIGTRFADDLSQETAIEKCKKSLERKTEEEELQTI
jgi:hypothetical protein